MGNCCGSQSGGGNFKGEGRTLGAAPANAPPQTDGARASVPPKISSPSAGRTVGRNPQAPDQSQGPKEAAARAAQERATANSQGQGKLGKELSARKGQTVAGALDQGARENVSQRQADAALRNQQDWNS